MITNSAFSLISNLYSMENVIQSIKTKFVPNIPVREYFWCQSHHWHRKAQGKRIYGNKTPQVQTLKVKNQATNCSIKQILSFHFNWKVCLPNVLEDSITLKLLSYSKSLPGPGCCGEMSQFLPSSSYCPFWHSSRGILWDVYGHPSLTHTIHHPHTPDTHIAVP